MLSRVDRALTRPNPLFEKMPFGGISGERKCSCEVLCCGIVFPAPVLKLAECSMVKGIADKPFGIADRVKFLQSAQRSFGLTDRDGPVERHHWGRPISQPQAWSSIQFT